MCGFIKKIWLLGLLWVFCSNPLLAAVVQLNATGGTSETNALRIYIDDTTQIQVRRLNNTGQLYSPSVVPTNTNLDNGIYLRANNVMYGPDHFAYSAATDYTSRSVSTVLPATPSQGVTQSTTSSFRVGTLGPQVSVVWKYIYPLDYVTAEVTLVIPVTFTVNASNPVRYYHAIDTYLGGSDNGCGVRYIDANGKQVVGTYPLSSGNCPSSNSLPANLDVVESFRERTGKFDHYCVGFWNTFWTNANNACAIGKTTSLSDTVTTTYQDTGAAIEYDFTAPGTYTFSYDFVVGSTFVPNYDHLEIRHSGTSTLCPADVKVLACTSSVVPCPDNSLVNTGSLKGKIIYSPSSPTVTATPTPFDIGSAGPLATVSLQASSAATYILGADELTKAPLSGVKCWNTATSSQSCSFTFTNTPCLTTFECMESGLSYSTTARNPIYTKVAGKGFDLDVYALASGNAKSPGYTGNDVTVELVNGNGGCGSGRVSKKITFLSTDAGKKTVSFTDAEVAFASPELRCRVTDNVLVKTGCSSDSFTLRPQTLTVSSTNAQNTDPAATPPEGSQPVFKSSTSEFNLTVSGTGANNADINGYNGTPKIRAVAKPLTPHPSAVEVTPGEKVVGVLTGNFSPNNSSNFKYSEVGHFQINPNVIYDDTFAKVDIDAKDCDDVNNPYDNNGVGTPKKYGCWVQNTLKTKYFGRFVPDRLLVTRQASVNACNTFAYFDQDPSVVTSFNITAQNGVGATTLNYSGNYAKLALNQYDRYVFAASTTEGSSTTPLIGASLSASASDSTPISKIVDNSLPVWSNGVTAVRVKHKLSRPVAPRNKQNIHVTTKPSDTDGITSTDSVKLTDISGVEFRYGRLALIPAHGSELLPLAVPVEAQYYKDNIYVRSANDSCTTIDPKSITMKNYKGNLSACETYITNVTAASNGLANVILAAPKIGGDGKPNIGSVDLEINLDSAAGDQTCQNSGSPVSATKADKSWFGTVEPSARASFGIYKAPIIYMRENY